MSPINNPMTVFPDRRHSTHECIDSSCAARTKLSTMLYESEFYKLKQELSEIKEIVKDIQKNQDKKYKKINGIWRK